MSGPGAGTPGSGAPAEAEYVFEPHAVKLPPLRPYLQELWDRRRFVRTLARTEIQGRRSSTVAGQLWSVLDPLFQAAIYFFLIQILRGGQGGRGTAYQMTLLISGVFLFQFTRVSLNEGARSVVGGRGLLLNSAFPRALLPISAVYKGLVLLAPAGAVYLVIHLAAGRPIGPGVAFLPMLLVLHTILNLGLALLFAALNVYMRDVQQLMGYLLRVLFFVTPILYPVWLLPSGVRTGMAFNPLFPLFVAYQEVVGGGVPTIGQLIGALFWAVLFLVIGGGLFLSHERAFALHV
jgi:ABC-type polysaccharide/polyol phosphate export permease